MAKRSIPIAEVKKFYDTIAVGTYDSILLISDEEVARAAVFLIMGTVTQHAKTLHKILCYSAEEINTLLDRARKYKIFMGNLIVNSESIGSVDSEKPVAIKVTALLLDSMVLAGVLKRRFHSDGEIRYSPEREKA